MNVRAPVLPLGTSTCSYVVAGIPCVVRANPAILEYVEVTYGAYRADALENATYTVTVSPAGQAFVLTDSEGRVRECVDETDAVFATMERVVRHVTGRLAERGTYAIHASSLVHREQAVIIPGKSHSGKTTLALALVSRGLGILSDEFALSAPDARTIMPYRRGLHIRPGTPELIDELRFLTNRPFHPLSGGFQWTLPVEELGEIFPTCLAEPAPLGHVVILEPRGDDKVSRLEPISNGILTVELARSTTAAAHDLPGSIQRMTKLLEGARCCRLRPGELMSSVELLLDWLDEDG